MRRVYWNLWRKTVGERNKSRFKKGAHIRDSIERVETSEWQPADKGILCYFTWYYYHYKQYEWIESLVENRDATCCLRAFRCKCVMLNKHVSPCFCFVFCFFLFLFVFFFFYFYLLFRWNIIFRRGYWSDQRYGTRRAQAAKQCTYIYSLSTYCICALQPDMLGKGGNVKKKETKHKNVMHSLSLSLLASSSFDGVTKPGHPWSIILARQSVKRVETMHIYIRIREQPLYTSHIHTTIYV